MLLPFERPMRRASARFGVSLARVGISLALIVLVDAASSRDADAYCRTTTQPLPASYSPTRGCFTDGLLLFWRNACVSYSINAAASKMVPFEDAQRIIDTSFDAWNATICAATGTAVGIVASNAGQATCAEVRYNPDSPNQNLIIFRDDGWPYSDPNSTLGLTTVTFNADTGEIFDADMEINSSGQNLSITEKVPADGFDLTSVVTHEAGHFFGLAHATSANSTMFASYKPGTTALRSLAADDAEGLCAIYPSKATRAVSESVSPTSIVPADACNAAPRHGLAGECVVPPKPQEKCAASPMPRSSFPPISGVALAAALGVLVARRRRVSPIGMG